MSLRDLQEPEGELLWAVFRDAGLVTRLARAPGGWRTLSDHEMKKLDLTEVETKAVLALQQLVKQSYPELPEIFFGQPATVAKVYEQRLGGTAHEVVLALALDRRHHLLAEIELARGGLHGAALTAPDVLRPLIRVGASAFILIHNHPSGDPTPSADDIAMTGAVGIAGEMVGLPLADHLIIGGRGGGYRSFFQLGLLNVSSAELHRAAHEGR